MYALRMWFAFSSPVEVCWDPSVFIHGGPCHSLPTVSTSPVCLVVSAGSLLFRAPSSEFFLQIGQCPAPVRQITEVQCFELSEWFSLRVQSYISLVNAMLTVN
jgi:hypothetical protein